MLRVSGVGWFSEALDLRVLLCGYFGVEVNACLFGLCHAFKV